MPSQTATRLIEAARQLSDAVDQLRFDEPVTHVYNPLRYAWTAHQQYLTRFGKRSCEVLMLGMNPGPWGMAQTGVPFGEVAAVRDWMKINTPVQRPDQEHPKRPIEGFDCPRSEVSGRRLWGLFAQRYPSADDFFKLHFVTNYCPLVFMETSARNVTPDKLAKHEREAIQQVCDAHLTEVIEILKPTWLVGVGGFAEQCLQRVASEKHKIGKILHPSPASPAANRGWSEAATKQLTDLGIWR